MIDGRARSGTCIIFEEFISITSATDFGANRTRDDGATSDGCCGACSIVQKSVRRTCGAGVLGGPGGTTSGHVGNAVPVLERMSWIAGGANAVAGISGAIRFGGLSE